jgi:hypothetical protein
MAKQDEALGCEWRIAFCPTVELCIPTARLLRKTEKCPHLRFAERQGNHTLFLGRSPNPRCSDIRDCVAVEDTRA